MERDFPRPSLLAVLGLCVGLVWARAVELASWPIALSVLAVALVAVGAARARPMGRSIGIVGAFLAAGLLLWVPYAREGAAARTALAQLEAASPGDVSVEGEVASQPRAGATSTLLWLRPGATVRRGSVAVTWPTELPLRVTPQSGERFARGDRLQALGRILPVAEDPDPRSFDAWYESHGVVAEVRSRWYERIGTRPPSRLGGVLSYGDRSADALERVLRSELDVEAASVALAMTIGRTGTMPDELENVYRRAGLSHLFSVSGLHTGLVAAALAILAGLLGLGGRARAVLILGGVAFFCALGGFRPPAVRSALLVAIFVGQPLLRRQVDTLAALATVALAMLGFAPRLLFQVDFQMTFLCAIALACASPGAVSIQENLGRRMGWRWWSTPILITLQTFFLGSVVQLALAPILILRFGEVSLIAPVANILAIPLSALLVPGSLAAAIVHAISPALGEITFGAVTLIEFLLTGWARACALIPGASVRFGAPPPTWLLSLYYAVLLAGRWVRLRPRFSAWDGGASAAMCGAAAVALLLWAPLGSPRVPLLEIRFLDVGQGDAILLRTSGGETMLVDAGPDRRGAIVGDLAELGVRSLDVFVLTHADADHVGGADDVVRALTIDQILVGGSSARTGVWQSLDTEVDFRDVPVTTVRRGASFDLGPDVRVWILHPTAAFDEDEAERNDASVVLMVEAAGIRTLLTGDAERRAELDMLEDMGGEALRCEILKAGHHGSASSSTMAFLVAAAPQLAVISCGRNNRYGHPAPDVMARLAEMGCSVTRTDLQGAVTVTIEVDGTWGVRTEHAQSALKND